MKLIASRKRRRLDPAFMGAMAKTIAPDRKAGKGLGLITAAKITEIPARGQMSAIAVAAFQSPTYARRHWWRQRRCDYRCALCCKAMVVQTDRSSAPRPLAELLPARRCPMALYWEKDGCIDRRTVRQSSRFLRPPIRAATRL